MSRDTYWRAVEPEYQPAVTLGMVQGAAGLSIIGHADNTLAASVPFEVWDAKIAVAFLTAASALEILSASANDAAAGTGARTVLVITLDANYNEVVQVVTLNGVTPVALTGTHLAVNTVVVLTAGSGRTNAGDLTVRVPGPGSTQGFMLAGTSLMRAAFFTVPALKTLLVTNILNVVNRAGGSGATATVPFFIRTPGGVNIEAQKSTIAEGSPIVIDIPAGFAVAEKTTFGYRCVNLSANGIEMVFNLTGVIVNNNNIPP